MLAVLAHRAEVFILAAVVEVLGQLAHLGRVRQTVELVFNHQSAARQHLGLAVVVAAHTMLVAQTLALAEMVEAVLA
jgi:hypothetical protein